MKQYFYKLIYNRNVNFLLRNINKALVLILPRWLRLPPSGIITIKFNRKTLKLETNQTSSVTQIIFWDGYRNFEYTNIFISLIKKVDIFYDIGANIGYYSIISSFENPNIKVFSFEPAAGPLHFLKKNVKLNKLKNIKIESKALSDKTGEITFHEIQNKKYKFLKHNLSGEGSTMGVIPGRKFIKRKVETISLDNYTTSNHHTIDLIKIDTEGTESLILSQASNILKNMKPIIICETLFNTIENQLEEILLQYGYQFFNHVERGLKKVDTIKRETDNGVRNCFFVHPEKQHLISEFII